MGSRFVKKTGNSHSFKPFLTLFQSYYFFSLQLYFPPPMNSCHFSMLRPRAAFGIWLSQTWISDPIVFSILPLWFCFLDLLVTLLPPFFFGTMILALSFPSPFLTWRDVQHVIVRTSRAGHLNANDWKTNAAGFKGENFFRILSQAKYFSFSPILNGEQALEPFKWTSALCADTRRT